MGKADSVLLKLCTINFLGILPIPYLEGKGASAPKALR
jgi:hypothetical protein